MSGDLSLQPPTDGISSMAWSPDSNRLIVGSWDGNMYLYHMATPPQPPARLSHPAAVLAVTFGSNPTIAFSGGLDKRVREWDLASGQCKVLGKHDDAISSIVWCAEYNVLITCSWDSTLKVWDPSAETGLALRSTHTLPSRAYILSYAPSSQNLVVSMAHRDVHVYNLPALAAAVEGQVLEPAQKRESALKFLTRSLACMADGQGWASSSIEGRIAVEYFDPSPEVQASKYAFRAHRQTVDGADHVFPINAIAYHPIHNTFASGGSDGFISIWDHKSKKRMKAYPKYPTSVSALAFSPDGSKLAIGASYEHDNALSAEEQGRVMVLIKDTVMEDCRPKAKA
ncbi:hypothetical protein JCM24511_07044 [Saitozyma sp. JCM 24511]|nr:hypothetical protein JCM24511_07044 [Saitozyma sp. JCM 24511]